MKMVTGTAILLLAMQLSAAETADTVYFNGKVVTNGKAAAEAFSVKGGRFLSVGSTAEVKRSAAAGTKLIDLKGRTVLPGLMDSHTHPIGAALSERDGAIPTFHSIADVGEEHTAHEFSTRALLCSPFQTGSIVNVPAPTARPVVGTGTALTAQFCDAK